MREVLESVTKSLETSYFFQQIFPLTVLLVTPAFVLLARSYWQALAGLVSMVLESLGLSLPWRRKSYVFESSGLSASEEKKTKKTGAVRTRAEQVLANGSALHGHDEEPDLHYPGLVNISGTYCFLNSVLQAMASLAYLQPHIEAIHSKAVDLDVPTPVVDALLDTLIALNTPNSSRTSLRPVPMINALSQPGPDKRTKLFSSREHQDAQELFQLVSECVKNESIAVDKEGQRDRGLGSLANGLIKENSEVSAGVFDGLTANRRSCVECGYTEAVMHFSFDNWQLSIPTMTASCSLQDCLADYIRLEILTDCICRKCSMLATCRKLSQEADRLAESISGDTTVTQSKKKRVKEAKKLFARVKAAIEEGRIEEDIKGVKMEKVFSKRSTKQAMIARPPRVLALHLNRSVHYGGYAGRNSCRVVFPEILDLTPYTTSGQLSTIPSVPISMPPPPIPRSTTPTQSIYSTPRVLYRLSAVVCHYGAHSFGHYVCFRRKPQSSTSDHATLSPPKMTCPYGCECAECMTYGPVREDKPPVPGRGWLRISDDNVEECGIERVLAEGVGAFMLFYERVVHPRPPVYLTRTPHSSEETVRPVGELGNGSTVSISTLGGSGTSVGTSSFLSEGELERSIQSRLIVRPRVVRRTTAGRSRSASLANSEQASNETSHIFHQEHTVNGGPSKSSPSLQNGSAKPVLDDTHSSSSEHSDSDTWSHIEQSESTSLSSSTSSLASHTPIQSPKPSLEPSRTPSPTPSIKAAQARIRAPQPIRAHMSSNIAPVGLRA